MVLEFQKETFLEFLKKDLLVIMEESLVNPQEWDYICVKNFVIDLDWG